jgi:type IV pilus assembly protein PilC
LGAYKYSGYDLHGKKVQGEIAAGSTDEAERKAASQDIIIVSLIPLGNGSSTAGPQASGSRKLFGRKRIAEGDAAVILKNLAVMAETGVPFLDALDAVTISAKTPALQSDLGKLKEEVVGGRSLSSAMRSVPTLFPELVSDMVKIAEEGGRLDNALESAAGYLQRTSELRKKIINAMLYPMVMMGVSFLTVGVLIVFVMPRFASMFSKMQAQIPVTTKALLGLGAFVRGNPLMALALAVATVIGCKLALRLPAARTAVFKLGMRAPVLGELLRKIALARAFQSIATLLNANVAMMSALEHGAKVAGNPVISGALMRAREGVEHGGSLSDALRETGVFPAILLQMVAVGEKTGRLPALLATTSATMEEDVDSRLKALVSIIEPLMIVFMGAIVGTITISIITPIYSVVENIK